MSNSINQATRPNAAGKTLLLCFALAGRFKSPTAELIGRRIIATFDGREQELASAVDRRYRAFVPAGCRSGVKRSAVADLEKRIYPCSRGVVFGAEIHREMKKRK